MLTTRVIDDISIAAAALRDGFLVAFPTETVYGLGADATNANAIARLFAAKGRPGDNPLIVHLADINQWSQAASEMSEAAKILLASFSPGPITVVTRKNSEIVDAVTAGLNTVGIRIPQHATTQALLKMCGRPIAAPSANISGRPSCTNWQSVLEDMQGKIDFILKGDVCKIGIESTVVDCSGLHPVLLRRGAITREQLLEKVPDLQSCSSPSTGQAAASPGMRHPHYQPEASVYLIQSTSELKKIPDNELSQIAYAGMKMQSSDRQNDCELRLSRLLVYREFSTLEWYMREFYEFLREADRRGAKKIFLQIAADSGAGAALRDRQLRAAGQV